MMDIFMKLVWIPVLLICFQILWLLDGNYGGKLNAERNEEARQWLTSNKPTTTTSILLRLGYWTRFLFYTLYIYPFRYFAVNLGLFVFCVFMINRLH